MVTRPINRQLDEDQYHIKQPNLKPIYISIYICSTITSPKPEHDTWVAPSIRRAKS